MSLIGPGGVHANDRHLWPLVELARPGRVSPGSGSTPCSMGAIRRPRPSGTSPTSSPAGGRPSRRIARSGAGTTRWTVTSAGTAWSGATTPSSMARRPSASATGPSRPRTPAARPTSSSHRRHRRLRRRSGDPIIHTNFRADRARQLPTPSPTARPSPGSTGVADGSPAPADLLVVTMTASEEGWPLVAFPPEAAPSPRRLAEPAGASPTSPRPRSTRTSRTSSTAASSPLTRGGPPAHPQPEGRHLRPGPGDEAPGVTDTLVEAIGSGTYDVIVANNANPDMVGHTGVWDATIEALGVLDSCLARIVAAIEAVEARVTPARCAARDHRRPRQRRRAATRRVTR